MREIINKQKAPKDTVLNNIMKEIGEENGIAIDVSSEKIPKEIVLKKKQKRSWLRLFFYFILVIIVLFVLFVIYIITIATTEETTTKPLSSHQQIVVPIKENKPIEKSLKNINLAKEKTVQVPHVNKKQKTIKIPQTETVSLSKEKEEARIRKEAKAALMEQMRN